MNQMVTSLFVNCEMRNVESKKQTQALEVTLATAGTQASLQRSMPRREWLPGLYHHHHHLYYNHHCGQDLLN